MNERGAVVPVKRRDVLIGLLCLAAGGAAMSAMYLEVLQPAEPGPAVAPTDNQHSVPASDGSFDDALRERAALRARLDELMALEDRQKDAAAYLDVRSRFEACERAIDDLAQQDSLQVLAPPPAPFEPMPFPDGVSPVYRDARALRERVAAGLAAAPLEGHIEVVDCAEFPCIVSGWTLAPVDATPADLETRWRTVWEHLSERLPASAWHAVGGGPLPPGAPDQARAFHLAVWPYAKDPSAVLMRFNRRVADATTDWVEALP